MVGIILLLTFVASLWHERDVEIHLFNTHVKKKNQQTPYACLLVFSLWWVVISAELKHTGRDPEVHHAAAAALILPDACITWEQLY